MRIFALSAALLLLAACAPSGGGPGSPADEQALRQTNARYDRAIVAGDRAALEDILAADYVYVTAEGEVRDRTATIAHLTSGRVRIASQGSEEVTLRWLGDHALLVGRFRARVTIGGREVPLDERYSSIWAREGERWRLRHEHASAAPQRPE